MSEVIDASNTSAPANAPEESLVQLTHVTYALYAIGLLTAGVIAIAGLILAYIKLDDAKGTYIESHMSWLIRTFWWGLLWAALAWVFFFLFTLITLGIGIVVAWVPLAAAWIWFAYRIIKGWLRLTEKRAV
jgi:uncharacterized membrane protein